MTRTPLLVSFTFVEIDDHVCNALANNCAMIQKLNLSSSIITAVGARRIIENARSLRSFDLKLVPRLTDEDKQTLQHVNDMIHLKL